MADEQALLDLCARCLAIPSELSTALAKLKVTGKRSRWKSLRQALKTVWGAEGVANMRGRLVDLRDELDTRILLGLR